MVPKTLLLEVFLGTRGALGPCLQKGVPFWCPFCENEHILSPKGEPKITNVHDYCIKNASIFRCVFQELFFIVFCGFPTPPEPQKYTFYLSKTVVFENTPNRSWGAFLVDFGALLGALGVQFCDFFRICRRLIFHRFFWPLKNRKNKDFEPVLARNGKRDRK